LAARWLSQSTPAFLPVPTFVVLLVGWALVISCEGRYTEETSSKVVKLRNDVRAFARGDLGEVTGQTGSEEIYVLLYGYQRPLNELPISEKLQRELRDLTPYDYERYVLVRIVGDDIEEYTRWEPGREPLLSPVPFLIRGSPFRIKAESREPYEVSMRLEQPVGEL
jgi:hypothetical protein